MTTKELRQVCFIPQLESEMLDRLS